MFAHGFRLTLLFLLLFSINLVGKSQETTLSSKTKENLIGIDGQLISLEVPQGGALAFVFLWTECPISNQFSPTLNRLSNDFQDQPVRLIGLFVDADKTDEEVAQHASDYALNFPITRQASVRLARRFGVGVVPSTVVFNDKGEIVYRGRISDLFYDLGKRRQVSRSSELRDAIQAILAGEKVAIPYVEAVGCTLPDFGIED